MNLRRLFSLLNLHLAGVAVLLVLNLVLLMRLFFAWHDASSDKSEEYGSLHMTYMQLQAQMSHLQGLPQKVDQARTDADKFFDQRFAPNYSTMAGELGALAAKNNVRLTRAQYTPTPAIHGLTEVHIDASLSGEYAPLMRFINGIERDKDHVFFIINQVAFNGQQGGLVNVRLRMTTYLRSSSDLPPATNEQPQTNTEAAALRFPEVR
jgi:type IV pilus assembly protein PilO